MHCCFLALLPRPDDEWGRTNNNDEGCGIAHGEILSRNSKWQSSLVAATTTTTTAAALLVPTKKKKNDTAAAAAAARRKGPVTKTPMLVSPSTSSARCVDLNNFYLEREREAAQIIRMVRSRGSMSMMMMMMMMMLCALLARILL